MAGSLYANPICGFLITAGKLTYEGVSPFRSTVGLSGGSAIWGVVSPGTDALPGVPSI